MEVARSDGPLRGQMPDLRFASRSLPLPRRFLRLHRFARSPDLMSANNAQLTVAGQRRSLTGFPKRIPMHITRLAREVNRLNRALSVLSADD